MRNAVIKTWISKFRRDEDGAALVEYGIALLVVILVGTGALVLLAEDTEALFQGAQDATSNAVSQIPDAPVGDGT